MLPVGVQLHPGYQAVLSESKIPVVLLVPFDHNMQAVHRVRGLCNHSAPVRVLLDSLLRRHHLVPPAKPSPLRHPQAQHIPRQVPHSGPPNEGLLRRLNGMLPLKQRRRRTDSSPSLTLRRKAQSRERSQFRSCCKANWMKVC